jgi:alpha-beta hydrolase superfamily lysophospholipase
MFSDLLRIERRIWILTAGVATLLAGAVLFCGLSLQVVHCVAIPCFVGYVVIFRKDMHSRIRWYHWFYFVLLTVAVAAYLISLARMIPEIRVRWTEFPIAIWFLLTIHIVIWLIDRIVDKTLSALGTVWFLSFRKLTVPFEREGQAPFDGKTSSKGASPGSRHRLQFPKNVLRILCVAAIATPYLLAVFMVHWVKFADDTDPRRDLGVNFAPVHFEATDSTRLAGWFIPATRAPSDSTVIIAPGRGTTKACFLPYAMVLASNGYNVLLFDLRGQGASAGHTGSFGLLETNDVLGAVRYLKRAYPQAARRVFGLGISQGAPALIAAAARDERIRGIVLDSAVFRPGSLPDRTLCWLPWPLDKYVGTATQAFASAILGCNLFRQTQVQSDIARIHPRPVLIFHGAADKIADYARARDLYSLAKYPKRLCIIPGAGHEQVLLYTRNNYIGEIMEALGGGIDQ